jgi:hypothetical protein
VNDFADWANFYVITGSAGAALVGIQFVIVTLVTSLRVRTTHDSIKAFSTPTIVHFGGALLVAAIMTAPWPSLLSRSIALEVCGLAGVAYAIIIVIRTRRQTVYAPVWEDWLWHAILPCVVYGSLVAAAILLHTSHVVGMFVVGGATLGLLFIGIHNAWDAVTYIVVERQDESAGVRGEG